MSTQGFWSEEKKEMHRNLKQARYNILLYIDYLNRSRCELCARQREKYQNLTQCECEAAVEIRRLGKVLTGNKEKIIETYKELVVMQREKAYDNLTEENLTVELYTSLKAKGFTDKQIMEKIGWHSVKMNQWKRRKGLIKDASKTQPEEGKTEPKNYDDALDAVRYTAEISAKATEDIPVKGEEAKPAKTIKESILENIAEWIDSQEAKGLPKYGQTLDECPVEAYDWHTMIIEELIDALKYQQKKMQKMRSVPVDSMDAYQLSTKRTERQDLSDKDLLLNYGLGISGESGEIADMVKKHFFQGHTLDPEAIKSEIGDVLYYAARLAAVFGFKLSEVAVSNEKKLQERYPNGFTEKDSINRSV